MLTVSDVWKPDFSAEARHVFGTEDDHHPGVFTLVRNSFPVYVGGRLEGMELPEHHTFGEFRHTPAELRVLFEQRGWNRVVAFQTRKPMHRAHVELTKRAMAAVGANLLIHAVVGLTRPGDVDCYTRVRCYKAAMAHYPSGAVALSLLPLAMRTGGPREAVWHAIIGKNYGCTHLIVGRNHAGPGPDRGGNPYYGPYDAQELLHKHQAELGIEAVPFRELLYSPSAKRYVTRSEVVNDEKTLSLSGTGLRERLNRGTEIPDWFSFPDVIGMLRKAYPPRAQQGFTVFFTGLPSSGKSTLANILMAKLMEIGTRPVTVLDGDVVRKHLSSELGFSREHRDLNIRRIGYVASEITKNRGVAICAPIAPYDATRREVRAMVSPYGGFIEVHVSTPIEVCESRDPKGLYAQARAGRIRNFTGIDDPYEVPNDAEVTVDNSTTTPEEGAVKVLSFLRAQGFVD